MILENVCLLYLLIISFTDLRSGRIPNFISFGFFVLMIVSNIIIAPSEIPIRLLCAFFFFFLFLCILLFTKGIGMGDVKLAFVIGYCSGFFNTSFVFIFACLGGIIFFLIAYRFKRKINKIPFAPFVTAGYLMSELLCRRML